MFIHFPVEAELHSYLGSICNKSEYQVIKVGGYDSIVNEKTNTATKAVFVLK